jgi:hypothetical protein
MKSTDLILPGRDTRLLDKRFEDEHDAARAETAISPHFREGPPPIPDAQIVVNMAKGTTGVAVKGARYVCQLPKGYAGPALELAAIEGNRFIVTHPNHVPLLIDPQTGATRPL